MPMEATKPSTGLRSPPALDGVVPPEISAAGSSQGCDSLAQGLTRKESRKSSGHRRARCQARGKHSPSAMSMPGLVDAASPAVPAPVSVLSEREPPRHKEGEYRLWSSSEEPEPPSQRSGPPEAMSVSPEPGYAGGLWSSTGKGQPWPTEARYPGPDTLTPPLTASS